MDTLNTHQICKGKTNFLTSSPLSKKNKEKKFSPSEYKKLTAFNRNTSHSIKNISMDFIEIDEIDLTENDIFVRETIIDENDIDQDRLWRYEVDHLHLNQIRVWSAT